MTESTASEKGTPAAEMTDDEFAAEFRDWLGANLVGEFAEIKGVGGPGSEHEFFPQRLAWERHMAAAGWTCVGWPVEHGGRGASLSQQVRFHEEYAKADAPARVSHLGETLLGPTLIAHGTQEQKDRFLPRIIDVTELWAQGYSEPGAGSDLANVATTARLGEDGKWHLHGQKVWTSLAHLSQWAFVVARTEEGTSRHRGLSFLLVPLDQPGVEIRPIQQLTGTSEFNEVFFDDAVTDAEMIVGERGEGWKVAMTLLEFERGVSTLGQQVGFARELEQITAMARANGSAEVPAVRERITRAWIGLKVIRAHALRTLAERDATGGNASAAKLLWANWHRDLGELAMEVQGTESLTGPTHTSEGAPNDLRDPENLELAQWQRLFLFTRSDTIYGGSNEIQRNIISERVLGLPREARPS
ncbi:acyl-CoA dehydrogenase family protein [Dietzia cinnamea]|uniref:acyl-CoA dehydrogenase family protein n=1 Tax=Dietzia cinnamea TaxID=321318 RepID=UPI0021B0210D|nr:acyl-CoA dehydrogenase family protein [Dietzia cinnamea]MCT2062432.1 acyl-CoA dehydrogenase family protein [Dietzia cinnamea]MCT2236980.1 acyl-CoA dehydrogenase family protein [Dietzia cinnamea]MCT2301482.1 acyl-CoA dehydrogenase family protein [Dietzia cinnamea]